MSIIVRLMGGLGNQLFQYSLGRSLAVKNNLPLLLDLSFLKIRGDNLGRVIRDYELSVFKINAPAANDEFIHQIRKFKDHPVWRRIHHYFPLLSPVDIYMEKNFTFDDSINRIKGKAYLEGYWQSEKYFLSIENILREELQFISPATGRNAELMNEMRGTNAISIHIRRGDMVNLKAAAEFHGSCDPSYYYEGLNLIKKKVSNPSLYIFSDDITWVKANLQFNDPVTFVDWNQGKSSFEDLRLMSNCKHHIIANSSFSWWGAWLNASPDKFVISPKKWFNNSTIDTSDLIPAKWLRI